MKRYTKEEKIKICKLFLESNSKYEDFSKCYKLSSICLRNWVKNYNLFWDGAFDNSKTHLEEKLKSLQKENKKLKKQLKDQELRDEMYSDLRRLINKKK
ncbi:hypothetical protein SLITO_v1c05650 [Spiroplasma litorale]|uniref:Transposase n=1 Tax=Spiroplasma litorale TaxID=216942 RepID=A0A0K1W1Z0_9MOLU|nr:transposase [Spiroplasma litorale]AKX34201.1 hypothetical protein SLITO_v1c05650 [Spiroplasma litorale]